MPSLKEYVGGLTATETIGTVLVGATSFSVLSGTGYPTGGALGNFCLVLDRGNAGEEVVLCSGRSTNNFTVVTRGYDGTTAVEHTGAGITVEHCIDAVSLQESSTHINAVGGADGWVTNRKLDTATKAQVALADTNAAALALIPPVGVMFEFAGASAPAGYLLCDGAAVSRTTYATLFALITDDYGIGDGTTTFNVPDFTDRVAVGAGTQAIALAAGSDDVTLATGNLPVHAHTGAVHTHSQAHTHNGAAHTHTGSALTVSTDPAASIGVKLDGTGQEVALSSNETSLGLGAGTAVSNRVAIFTSGSASTDRAKVVVPSHAHSVTGSTGAASATTTAGVNTANTGAASAANTGNVGSGTAVSILQPYLVCSKIIKY